MRPMAQRLALAWLLIVLVGHAPAGQPQPPVPSAARPPDSEAAVKFYMGSIIDAGIVGSSFVLLRDNDPVTDAYVGYQDLDAKRPVDRETIYHWASITKTFTGIAIMQLRDRGLLSLDDPVVKYVPELRRIHNPFGDVSQVTVRMLMSHSAGFRAGTWPWGGDEPWHPFEPTKWEQLVAMLPYTQLLFPPGSKYSYSNPGVILLGRIIEELSGEDYEVYITKNILMPLSMQKTFFDRAPNHLRAHRSHSYFRTDDGLREARFDFDTGITVSNGGLNAPLTDMALYVRFLLGGLAPPSPVYDAVLKRSSLEEMWKPQIRAADGEGGSGNDVQAGLSFFIERHLGVELVGHSGNQNGFLSHFYLHHPSRTAYIVAFNTDVSSKSKGDRSITREVDDAIRDRLIRDGLVGPGRVSRQ
jgi:CubicO group peptidase (beta-lactamase class C family)